MTEQATDLTDRSPKHQLETGLLGKPKHGRQRVSELAAKHDEIADQSVDGPLDVSEDEEHST